MNYVESSSAAGKSPASVPRFQQRTNERAYLQGAFHPAAGMDYSSNLSHDQEAAGASPWGSSSPKQSRDFGPQSAADAHTPQYGSTGAEGGQGGQGGQYSARPSTSDSTTLAASENGDSDHSPYKNQAQAAPQHGQQYQYSPQQYHQSTEGEQRRPEAQRYHRPPQQQRSQIQYKLQCKVTGLERTGKKDPILRFDAYVCGQPGGTIACLIVY